MGGDEFGVLMVDFPPTETDWLMGRLLRAVAAHSDDAGRQHTVSLSLGTAFYDPADPCSIFELLRRADQQMHGQKRDRGKHRR